MSFTVIEPAPTATLTIKDENNVLTTGALSINFVGAGVAAAHQGNEVTVNIPGGGVGTPNTPAAIKTANYTAVAGDVIIADTTAGSWDLTLPSTPALGDAPILVYGGSDFAVNPLIVRVGNQKFRRSATLSQKLKADTAFASFQLIYAGSAIGWLEFPGGKLGIVEPSPFGDPYFGQVVLLMHMDGASGSTTFTDVKNHVVTPSGNVQINTNQNKFGGSSAYFDGSGDYLSLPVSSDFQFGSENLTWECHVRPALVNPNQPMTILGNTQGSTSGNAGLFMAIHNSRFIFRHWVNGTQNATSNQIISANTWYHVAATKVGTQLKIFVDGIEGTSGSTSTANRDNQFLIGRTANNGGFAIDYQGYIDNIRLTKGVARYTNSFTPPTAPFPDA